MTGESLRALALIFTTPLIMAGGKFSEKNAFLIAKDDAKQDVGAGEFWNGLTSRIKMTGAFTLKAPSGVTVDAGTVIVVANDAGSGSLKVTLEPNPFPGSNMNEVTIEQDDYGSFLYVNEDIGFLPLGTTGNSTVA